MDCYWCKTSKHGKCVMHGGPNHAERQREKGREYQKRRRAKIAEQNKAANEDFKRRWDKETKRGS